MTNIEDLVVAIRAIDHNNSFLVILLGLTASYLIKELLRPPMWMVVVSIPTMIAAAFSSVAVMRSMSWYVTDDEAVNTIIGSCAGLILCFVIAATIFRVVAELRDDTRSGPYEPKHRLTSNPGE
jgi:hypothetical protein